MTDASSPQYSSGSEWERRNAAFHKALALYPDSHLALHYLWNNAVASAGINGAAQPPADLDRHTLVLSPEAYNKFIEACENPAEPTEALKEMFRKYGRFSEPAQAASDALRAAAERVCWFDWSDNDMDAVAAIDALRKALVVSSTPRAAEAPVSGPKQHGWPVGTRICDCVTGEVEPQPCHCELATGVPIPDGDPEIADGEWPNIDDDGQPISSTQSQSPVCSGCDKPVSESECAIAWTKWWHHDCYHREADRRKEMVSSPESQ